MPGERRDEDETTEHLTVAPPPQSPADGAWGPATGWQHPASAEVPPVAPPPTVPPPGAPPPGAPPPAGTGYAGAGTWDAAAGPGFAVGAPTTSTGTPYQPWYQWRPGPLPAAPYQAPAYAPQPYGGSQSAPPSPQQWPAGYGYAPPYWASPQYGSSPLATIAGLALLITGILLILFGLLMVVVGIGGAALIDETDPALLGVGAAFAAAILTVVGVIGLVIGALHMAAAIGTFNHKSWARWLGVVMGAVGFVFGLLVLIAMLQPPAASAGELLIAIGWLAAQGFSAAALAAAGDHFSAAYPPR